MATNTYLTMQQRIADEFINTAVTNAHIKNAIQSAIAYYEITPLYFNQKQATFNTIASREYYDATDLADIPDIGHIRSAVVALNGIKNPLYQAEFNDIDAAQSGVMIGFPYNYAIYSRKLRLFPIPDAAYPITLSYVTLLPALVNDTDTNGWMVEGEAVIRQRAKRILALDILYSDEMAMRCKSLEDEEFESLMDETRARTASTSLKYPQIMPTRSFNIYQG